MLYIKLNHYCQIFMYNNMQGPSVFIYYIPIYKSCKFNPREKSFISASNPE